MTRWKKTLIAFAILVLAMVQCTPVFVVASWLEMVAVLESAKREGVYTTPEDGIRARAAESWIDVEKVEIVRAGPNAFDGSNPRVWFVTAKVWAAKRGDGKAVHRRGYDLAGSFFLQVRDGWVHVSEGHLPPLIGRWMDLFSYSG